MKVSSNVKEGFKPITLEIVIESEEEARALYAIFNHTHNAKLLPKDFPEAIHKCIGEKFRVLPNGVIANNLRYSAYYLHMKPNNWV